MTLATLISELEAATEGSRELDERVALAIGRKATVTIGDGIITERRAVPARCPPYTTSIDAALTLVPEGRTWAVGIRGETGRADAFVSHNASLNDEAATPALALTIAALKARQETEK